MLFYDIVLTLDREMESIWLKPKYSWMTLLWALVRRRPHSFAGSPPLLPTQGDLELTRFFVTTEPVSLPSWLHRHHRL